MVAIPEAPKSNLLVVAQQILSEEVAAGVRQVWVVYPTERLVHVDDSPLHMRGVPHDGTLHADDILPGFRLPLAELFDDTGSA